MWSTLTATLSEFIRVILWQGQGGGNTLVVSYQAVTLKLVMCTVPSSKIRGQQGLVDLRLV